MRNNLQTSLRGGNYGSKSHTAGKGQYQIISREWALIRDSMAQHISPSVSESGFIVNRSLGPSVFGKSPEPPEKRGPRADPASWEQAPVQATPLQSLLTSEHEPDQFLKHFAAVK